MTSSQPSAAEIARYPIDGAIPPRYGALLEMLTILILCVGLGFSSMLVASLLLIVD
jgi:hypothetical protein